MGATLIVARRPARDIKSPIKTVSEVLRRYNIAPAQERTRTTPWKEFIRSHLDVLAFIVEALTWRGLVTFHVLFFIEVGRPTPYR